MLFSGADLRFLWRPPTKMRPRKVPNVDHSLDQRSITFRAATDDDRDFAWRLYAEAVEPHISPIITARFNRGWSHDHERARFSTWWTPENTSIIRHGDEEVGWFHLEEGADELTLLNFCIASKFRGRGIGEKSITALLESWKPKGKPILHTVLKDSPHRGFFERFGFQVVNDDDIVHSMRREVST